jgi:hypothetical protein
LIDHLRIEGEEIIFSAPKGSDPAKLIEVSKSLNHFNSQLKINKIRHMEKIRAMTMSRNEQAKTYR